MGFKLPFRYNSPNFQVFLVGFICFCCPGMFNALNGIGGAGRSSPKATDNANTALSITFTLCSLIGAPAYNMFGHRIIVPAALAYVLYVGSYLATSDAFTIATGAVLGIGAGFLWTAQAGIMMSYPQENDKGKAFSIFWMVFNLGATLGAAIPLGNEWNSVKGDVKPGTYIAFMVIMTVGAFLALALLPASKVVRADGSYVSLHKFSNWRREAVEIMNLFKDWRMLILIPLFAGSNWFYTYQFQVYNGGGYFNLRARGLNNLVYWLLQILGAGAFGWLLDLECLGNRRRRAMIGNTLVFVCMTALWIACIFIQMRFTRESVKAEGFAPTDVFSSGYVGLLIEYAGFGLGDAIYQGFIYWLLGTMTNDTERAARYGGFYKTVQNAANAIAAQIDAQHVPYMTELIITFAVNTVGLLLTYVVCWTVPDVTVEEVDNLQDGHAVGTLVGGRVETVESVEAGKETYEETKAYN
ncbi:major facilitator superfamily domain-containing protein [Radiomyces spectabilis]|uniref:major facilitator superfamily domain-containing protein n=1 Tax=Radiomyces spectabilis TaxID=64574 RepID=UPI00221F49D3|nr:major facilitator superfamily domain-containing protein [Radiomyces spectabilis]KAI8394089.1 major facilitator superfamily domain-containing protein [Radiomyces spectabilis]